MLAYRYKEDTKEFEEIIEAQENPVDGGYFCPGHSTFKEIPPYEEGQIAIFNIDEDEWEIKEDHRNHYQVKLDDMTFSEVDFIGSANEGYQFITDEEYNNYIEDNDRYKIVNGVFTDVSDTPEYKALKLEQAKDSKYQEALDEAYNYLDNEAAFQFSATYHVEATKENMNSFSMAAIAIEKELIPYHEWTSKEDNVRKFNMEECLTVALGIKAIQSEVWNQKFITYKNAIKKAKTIEAVNNIRINYTI